MGRKPLVVWAGLLALLMSGCDSLPFFGGDQASEPSPTSTAPATPQGSPIAAGSPMAPPTSPRAGASPAGAIGTVPLAPNARPGSPATPSPTAANAPSGLITTTSPEDALLRSQQGRNDPFAPVAVQPLVRGTTGTAGGTGTTAAANLPNNAPLVQRPVPALPQIPPPPQSSLTYFLPLLHHVQ
ncbi:MAG: hypothetical protein HC916_19090 [Coleofasciculaceae cyanobacterium SM2_1_6]|nr:hypothetical protein [Coleofasciculaceae cyanobacterium SM2_1_6]